MTVGLFGLTQLLSSIRNVGLIDVDVTGADLAGGLIGFNFGEIRASYVTGRVSGRRKCGRAGGDQQSQLARFAAATPQVACQVKTTWADWLGTTAAPSPPPTPPAACQVRIRRGWAGREQQVHRRDHRRLRHEPSFPEIPIWVDWWGGTRAGPSPPAIGIGRHQAYTFRFSSGEAKIDRDSCRRPRASAASIKVGTLDGNDDPWDFGTSGQYPVAQVAGHGDGTGGRRHGRSSATSFGPDRL